MLVLNGYLSLEKIVLEDFFVVVNVKNTYHLRGHSLRPPHSQAFSYYNLNPFSLLQVKYKHIEPEKQMKFPKTTI